MKRSMNVAELDGSIDTKEIVSSMKNVSLSKSSSKLSLSPNRAAAGLIRKGGFSRSRSSLLLMRHRRHVVHNASADSLSTDSISSSSSSSSSFRIRRSSTSSFMTSRKSYRVDLCALNNIISDDEDIDERDNSHHAEAVRGRKTGSSSSLTSTSDHHQHHNNDWGFFFD